MLRLLIERMAGKVGLPLLDLSEGIRVRRSATHEFTFDYAAEPVLVPPLSDTLAPASWHITALEG